MSNEMLQSTAATKSRNKQRWLKPTLWVLAGLAYLAIVIPTALNVHRFWIESQELPLFDLTCRQTSRDPSLYCETLPSLSSRCLEVLMVISPCILLLGATAVGLLLRLEAYDECGQRHGIRWWEGLLLFVGAIASAYTSYQLSVAMW